MASHARNPNPPRPCKKGRPRNHPQPPFPPNPRYPAADNDNTGAPSHGSSGATPKTHPPKPLGCEHDYPLHPLSGSDSLTPARDSSADLWVALSSLALLFFLGLLCLLHWRLHSRRNGSGVGGWQDAGGAPDPPPHHPWLLRTVGLHQSTVDSIAVYEYTRGGGPVEGTECSVCLSSFREGDRLRLLPKCTHAFHLPCIDPWLRCHRNCPLCRAPVLGDRVDAPVRDPNQAALEVEDLGSGGGSETGAGMPVADGSAVGSGGGEQGQEGDGRKESNPGVHEKGRRGGSSCDPLSDGLTESSSMRRSSRVRPAPKRSLSCPRLGSVLR